MNWTVGLMAVSWVELRAEKLEMSMAEKMAGLWAIQKADKWGSKKVAVMEMTSAVMLAAQKAAS